MFVEVKNMYIIRIYLKRFLNHCVILFVPTFGCYLNGAFLGMYYKNNVNYQILNKFKVHFYDDQYRRYKI